VRCVRTVRLGLPNTALLPYKMGGSLQRLLAVRGMGRDPQRREMGDAGSGARDWKGRSVPEFDGGTVRQADDKPVRSCRLPCSARRWVGRGCLLPATQRQLEELKLVQNTPSHGCLDDKARCWRQMLPTPRIVPLQIVFVQRGCDLFHCADHPCELVVFLHSDPSAKLPFTLILQNWSGLRAEPFQNGKLGA